MEGVCNQPARGPNFMKNVSDRKREITEIQKYKRVEKKEKVRESDQRLSSLVVQSMKKKLTLCDNMHKLHVESGWSYAEND